MIGSKVSPHSDLRLVQAKGVMLFLDVLLGPGAGRTIAKSSVVTLSGAKGLRLRMRFFAPLGMTGCARNDGDCGSDFAIVLNP